MCLSMLLSLFGCGSKDRFLVDGPDMARKLWKEFTISQQSDEYEGNFSYTVKIDDETGDFYLWTEAFDYEAGYPIDKSIRISKKCANELINIDIMSFPDYVPDELEEMILDGTHQSLTVIDENGVLVKKSITSDKADAILELLAPYAKKLED